MRLWFKASVLFVSSIAAQSISTVLPAQNGLKTFISCISQFPELLAQLNGGNFTGMLTQTVLYAPLTTVSPRSYRRCFRVLSGLWREPEHHQQ
jgi:hypothetical protein